MSSFGDSSVPNKSGPLSVYSDGTRPAATTYAAGGQIYNTSDAAPNWSDGAVWRDAAGVVT